MMFIAIEGVDASGKATQSKLLAERLIREGYETDLYSFPRYETPLGSAILRHLKGALVMMNNTLPRQVDAANDLVFQCMMLADKYDATCEIQSKLESDIHIVADRWAPSAICYGAADGLSVDWLIRTQAALVRPHLTIFIELSVETALQRRPKLRDRYETDREKQKSVREQYDRLWKVGEAAQQDREWWRRVDGERTVEEVHEAIWSLVLERRKQM